MERTQDHPVRAMRRPNRQSHHRHVTTAPEPEIARPTQWSRELQSLRQRLHVDFGDLPADTIDHCLASEIIRFDGCRITSFVPILIEKNVRARLRAVRAPRARMVVVPD